MTPDETQRVLTSLAAAWAGLTIGPATAVAWSDALADLDADDVANAARKIILGDERFPSIARVRALAHAEALRRRPTYGRELGDRPKLPPCRDCGGTGWRDNGAGTNTVLRCDCESPRTRHVTCPDCGEQHDDVAIKHERHDAMAELARTAIQAAEVPKLAKTRLTTGATP